MNYKVYYKIYRMIILLWLYILHSNYSAEFAHIYLNVHQYLISLILNIHIFFMKAHFLFLIGVLYIIQYLL